MDPDNQSEELNESELGRIEYWEKCYKDELKQFERFGDAGEIWFGHDIVNRLKKWFKNTNHIKQEANIVDLGCGNGMLLIELATEGFKNLTGLDYSENAITLCKQVAEKHKMNINFIQCDILEVLNSEYDVILDKGTYDAISLSENAKVNRTKYKHNVHCSLHSDGFFIITSCNWTQSELVDFFKPHFCLLEVIPTPQFTFGGKVGNVVTICVFKKVT